MAIMDSFVKDMFEKIAVEASRLTSHNKRCTITSLEIQTSVKLLLTGDLAKNAVCKGMKAVQKYSVSCISNKKSK